MTLIVEDGTGLETAESYVSTTEADTYFENLSNLTWVGTTAVKESALRKATTYLDTTYSWIGIIYTTEQALGWPRTGVYDKEGRDIKESVPTLIKQAAYELALASLSEELVQNTSSSNYVKKEKVGELEVEYRTDAPTDRMYKFTDRLLSGLYIAKQGSMSVGVYRA